METVIHAGQKMKWLFQWSLFPFVLWVDMRDLCSQGIESQLLNLRSTLILDNQMLGEIYLLHKLLTIIYAQFTNQTLSLIFLSYSERLKLNMQPLKNTVNVA